MRMFVFQAIVVVCAVVLGVSMAPVFYPAEQPKEPSLADGRQLDVEAVDAARLEQRQIRAEMLEETWKVVNADKAETTKEIAKLRYELSLAELQLAAVAIVFPQRKIEQIKEAPKLKPDHEVWDRNRGDGVGRP